MRAIEALQAEMDERKRMETEVEKANTELFFISRQVKAAEMDAKNVPEPTGDRRPGTT
jgi:hypothetical protein